MRWHPLAFSTVGHLMILTIVFLVIPASRGKAVTRTIPVNLVSLPSGPATIKPPKSAPKTESRPKMEPEKTPNRPRDEVVKLPKGKEEKPQPIETPAPETKENDTAPVGAGLAAGVAVDAVDFEFTYYLIALRNRIGQNWSAPAGLVTSGNPVRAVVHFRIERDGRVVEPEVESSSGINFFDQSAIRAVMISSPVPPLPMGYAENELGVHFAFEYTGP